MRKVVGDAKMTKVFAVYFQASGFPRKSSEHALQCSREQLGRYGISRCWSCSFVCVGGLSSSCWCRFPSGVRCTHLLFPVDTNKVYVSQYNCPEGMQVLQYLREFDAPAMQSCKPLPCGTGPWPNRRLREQTLIRKPCHCGSIKGGWRMELPTSLDQPLQGQILCTCLDMFLPVWDLYLLPEKKPLVSCKSQRLFNTVCWQIPWNVQLHESPYRVDRHSDYQGPRCSTSYSVDSGKSARKKKTTTDNCTMDHQDS